MQKIGKQAKFFVIDDAQLKGMIYKAVYELTDIEDKYRVIIKSQVGLDLDDCIIGRDGTIFIADKTKMYFKHKKDLTQNLGSMGGFLPEGVKFYRVGRNSLLKANWTNFLLKKTDDKFFENIKPFLVESLIGYNFKANLEASRTGKSKDEATFILITDTPINAVTLKQKDKKVKTLLGRNLPNEIHEITEEEYFKIKESWNVNV